MPGHFFAAAAFVADVCLAPTFYAVELYRCLPQRRAASTAVYIKKHTVRRRAYAALGEFEEKAPLLC